MNPCVHSTYSTLITEISVQASGGRAKRAQYGRVAGNTREARTRAERVVALLAITYRGDNYLFFMMGLNEFDIEDDPLSDIHNTYMSLEQ